MHRPAAEGKINVHRELIKAAAAGHLFPDHRIDRHETGKFQADPHKADKAAQDRPPGGHVQCDGEIALDHVRSLRELRRTDQTVSDQRQQGAEHADL